MKKYLIIPAAALMSAYLYYQDFTLSCDSYTVSNDKLPEEFDGFRIAQVSDFHNNHNRHLNSQIIDKLTENRPDIIVITGDLFDKRRTDLSQAYEMAIELSRIAPAYYVSGNHEGKKPAEFEKLIEMLSEHDVTVLRDTSAVITRGNSHITLYGTDSPRFLTESRHITMVMPLVEEKLKHLEPEKDTFNILLAHHPEYFDAYAKAGYDLILSGHAHGGQVRLPYVGGLFAPSQGAIPKYTYGPYHKDNSLLIVSRGIGNSLFPFRINNLPDLVYVTLQSEKKE